MTDINIQIFEELKKISNILASIDGRLQMLGENASTMPVKQIARASGAEIGAEVRARIAQARKEIEGSIRKPDQSLAGIFAND